MPTILTPTKISRLMRDLEKQGTRIEQQGKNVRKLYFPNGSSAQIHLLSDHNDWIYAARKRALAAGLTWPLDDRKAVRSQASAKPPVPADWERPTPPLEHVLAPPGTGYFDTKKRNRPTDKQIGYVRGALFKMGNPETFWTASVADELRDVTGFRNNSGSTEIQGTLDWLGYRVVEARKYKVGHIYRWVLDPTKDRAGAETLPMLVPQDKPVDEPVEPEETPAEPETPTPEPEAVSEAPVAAEEEVAPSDDVDYLKRRAEMNLEHYRRAKAERDEARREAEKLRGELAWAIRQRDDAEAAVEQLTQAEDGWNAIDFRPDRNWGEMQEWATSFGLDLVVKVKRA